MHYPDFLVFLVDLDFRLLRLGLVILAYLEDQEQLKRSLAFLVDRSILVGLELLTLNLVCPEYPEHLCFLGCPVDPVILWGQ